MAGQRRIGVTLLPLGLIFLAVGISMAVVGPFLSLFLSTEVHAGPLRTTAFLIIAPLCGVLVSTVLGRLSDRRAIRRTLLICAAAAGMVGTGITAFVREYWVLLALAATATALAASMFPQTFAYARQILLRDGPDRTAFGMSALRTVFSLAWVGGPPLAALLFTLGGFRYVYGMAAAMYALATLVAIRWLDELPASVPPGPEATEQVRGGPPQLVRTIVGFTCLSCPLTLAVQLLPLFVRTELGGQVSQAGLILGLCAAVEIPLMLGLGALAGRVPLGRLVRGGAVCGVLYYGTVALTHHVALLYPAQILNALFIAAVSGLGISYVQDMLPGQPGRASTLFSNTFPIGAMVAGPMFGLAQQFGYRLGYVFSAALSLAGLLLLLDYRRPRRQPSPLRAPEVRQDRNAAFS
jgi:SET family sugar efflux transporter-like MFS transporter